MSNEPSAPPAPARKARAKSVRSAHPEPLEAQTGVRLVSGVLIDAFERIYKLGGLVLLALFIGTLLMVLPFVATTVRGDRWGGAEHSGSQIVILGTFGVGVLIVASVLIASLAAAVLKRQDLRQTLRDNGEMADALQSVALRVTEATLQLQSLLLVNAQSVADMLVAATPVLRLFGAEDLARQGNLNVQIVETLEAARGIAERARSAISDSNPKPLLGYTEELAKLNQAVVAALKQPRAGLDELSSELQLSVTRLKQCVVDFSAGVDAVNTRALRYLGVVNGIGNMLLVGPFLRQNGLDTALDEGERLESLLNLTATANHALAEALRTGRLAEFIVAVEQISQLRALTTLHANERSPSS